MLAITPGSKCATAAAAPLRFFASNDNISLSKMFNRCAEARLSSCTTRT
jgi:hypothetical protein